MLPDERVVMVRHPSPMLVTRRRGRTRERRLVATSTPVVLRVGSREDLGEPHVVRVRHDTLTWRILGGALWYQVAGLPVDGRRKPARRFGAAEFVEFLEGGPAARDAPGTDLDLATRRTPIVAMPFGEDDATRGADIDGDGRPGAPIREIHVDGRDAASRDLRRFIDERVRLLGDAVLIRAYDPLVRPGPSGIAMDPFPQARDMSRRLARHRVPLGYRPDDYRAGMAWEAGMSGTPSAYRAGPWTAAIAGAPYGADTARLVAGLAAIAASGAFLELRDRYSHFLSGPDAAAGSAGLDGAADEALDWAGLAALGRIGAAEATGAVAAARRLAQAVAARYGDRATHVPMVVEAMALVRRFEEYEWPLLEGGQPGPDDLAALGTLAR